MSFTDFWEAYPKKVGKKLAEQKWRQKKLEERSAAIIEDVRRRAARSERWIKGFVPNPATYLHQERWEDELDEVQAERPKGDAAAALRADREYRHAMRESERMAFFDSMHHCRELYRRAMDGEKDHLDVRKFISETKKWPKRVRDRWAPFIRGEVDDLIGMLTDEEKEEMGIHG